MENETKRAEHPFSRWGRYGIRYPQLQLTHFRDKLDWLFGGEPDNPDVSLKNWNLFRAKMSEGNAREAALRLLRFSEHHQFTFRHSGWVKAALGQLILEDESASQEFIKPYWRRARRPLQKSTMGAYDSLTLMRDGHRKHWLAAGAWMLRFCEKNDLPGESCTLFVDRALIAYWDRAGVPEHSCLCEKALTAIAMTVWDDPTLSPAMLCDHALAKLYHTSPSTLAHLRADLRKRSRRSPR
jgi:hypothetical protein